MECVQLAVGLSACGIQPSIISGESFEYQFVLRSLCYEVRSRKWKTKTTLEISFWPTCTWPRTFGCSVESSMIKLLSERGLNRAAAAATNLRPFRCLEMMLIFNCHESCRKISRSSTNLFLVENHRRIAGESPWSLVVLRANSPSGSRCRSAIRRETQREMQRENRN